MYKLETEIKRFQNRNFWRLVKLRLNNYDNEIFYNTHVVRNFNKSLNLIYIKKLKN